jgi:hypothetical protein
MVAWVLSAPLAPALAQETSAQSACVSIDNDAERLACYDRANGRTPRAAPQLPAAPLTGPPPQAETSRDRILPSIGGLISGDGESAALPPVQLQIARVQRRAGGYTDCAPRVGEQVTVQRVAVGLFILTPQTGEPFRVRML